MISFYFWNYCRAYLSSTFTIQALSRTVWQQLWSSNVRFCQPVPTSGWLAAANVFTMDRFYQLLPGLLLCYVRVLKELFGQQSIWAEILLWRDQKLENGDEVKNAHFSEFWNLAKKLQKMEIFLREGLQKNMEIFHDFCHKGALLDRMAFTLLNARWWDVYLVGLFGGPKMTPNGPKMTQNGQKWPKCQESDIWNHIHRIAAPLAVVLSGHMTSLR